VSITGGCWERAALKAAASGPWYPLCDIKNFPRHHPFGVVRAEKKGGGGRMPAAAFHANIPRTARPDSSAGAS
jgi:hypothetical protein